MRGNGIEFTSNLLTFMLEADPPARDVEPMDFRADRLFYLCDLISLVRVSRVTPTAMAQARGVMRRLADDAKNALTVCLPRDLDMPRFHFQLVCERDTFAFKRMSTLVELGKAMCPAGWASKAQKAADFLQGLFDRSGKLVRRHAYGAYPSSSRRVRRSRR